MSEPEVTELGEGFRLKEEETDDCTERVYLISPDGAESLIVGGYEYMSPEDMVWRRDLRSLFYSGLYAGIAIGEARQKKVLGVDL